MDYDKLRQQMVDLQIISRGISDPRVLDAFRRVPRHIFVPEDMRDSAYSDCALPIGNGQTISQPYMVAAMTAQLKLKGNETVLEIGTGSGYQAAILSQLCQRVITIERVESLLEKAKKIIQQTGYNNIKFVTGDGTLGYPDSAPYDGIIVTAGCPRIPQPLVDQLKDKGRLVLPVGSTYQQVLTTVFKAGNEILTEESIPCVFVPLIGKFGWREV
ncbi:MAG: protein-L-isoaspartate(D-aspartate) O-methyltransferase [Candidatus Margulisbacteria bacterium]|nr:protein-L-isoaspartate(D-aspartate) O-methyltransferase [Candidatus Margulisiibacteriota bacterium]